MPTSHQGLLPLSKQLLRGVLLLLCWNASALAANSWQQLQTQRFGMISQMRDVTTRKWATEFEQFIEVLHQLYPQIDETHLPLLTVVLFDRERRFSPYRMQTNSGQAKDLVGFFGNLQEWSVIGMYGGGNSDETRHVIFHEATHWFLSANRIESPLWFEEGLAEVFSGFKVEDGISHWGLPLHNHIDYLSTVALQPLEQFLRVTQDDALHRVDSYYPQAWAFVHFLMFGNDGENRKKLSNFLNKIQTLPIDVAFAEAFGKSYIEMDKELRDYLRRSRFDHSKFALLAKRAEFAVSPATAFNIEFALARLAAAGDNNVLALQHANQVLALDPNRPEGYEVLALAASRLQENDAARLAINKAIELNSHDSTVYSLKAQQLLETHYQQAANVTDSALTPDIAREIADLFAQALRLRITNKVALRGFVVGLLNVAMVTAEDAALLKQATPAFPTDGTSMFGEAVVAHKQGDNKRAIELLSKAEVEPLRLPVELRSIAPALRDFWLSD